VNDMRDLLFLAHRMPYPPDKGDKIRAFHVLRHLARSFRVHLGCFSDDPNDAQYVERLRSKWHSLPGVPQTVVHHVKPEGPESFHRGTGPQSFGLECDRYYISG